MEVTVDQDLRSIAAEFVDDSEGRVDCRRGQRVVEFGGVLAELLRPVVGPLRQPRQAVRSRDGQLAMQSAGDRDDVLVMLEQRRGVRPLQDHGIAGVVAFVQLDRAMAVPSLEGIRLVVVAGVRERDLEHRALDWHDHADLAVRDVAVDRAVPTGQEIVDDRRQLGQPGGARLTLTVDRGASESLGDHHQRSDLAERDRKLNSMSLGVMSPATTLVTASAIGISTSW